MTSACSRWSHPLNAAISKWNGRTVEVYVGPIHLWDTGARSNQSAGPC